MKRVLAFLMVAIMLFTLAACGNESADPSADSTGTTAGSGTTGGDNDKLGIWDGVEGDELEFVFLVGGETQNVVLNRDGSCYLYAQQGDTMTGADFGRSDLDAEMGLYPTCYGSYEEKEGEVTATLDAQIYYRFLTWGKDADALKDAYFEDNMSEEYKEGYYGKGVVMSEEKGTVALVCNYDGETFTAASWTTYDENNVKASVIAINADGSHTDTAYYSNGNVEEIREYDAEDKYVKSEAYSEDGALEYIETVERNGDTATQTRVDAEGNVIRIYESKHKEYENGGYYSESTETVNGNVYYFLHIEKCDENGFVVHTYSENKTVEGNTIIYNVSYEDNQDANNNYSLSTENVDGILTYYRCAIEKVTVMEGVEGRQSVTYDSDRDIYALNVEYIDEDGGLVGIGYDYPASEYVHGEWETFEYVIE